MEVGGVDSIIVDILQRVDKPTDEDALAEHVSDVLLSFQGTRHALGPESTTIKLIR